MSDDIAKTEEDDFLVLLRKTFIDEATSFLADSEAALISLDDAAKREKALAEIFRAYHSVKGSAASVGFLDVAQFSHVAEDCLSVLRSKPHLVTSAIVSLLLQVNDTIRARIETLFEFSGEDPNWNTTALEASLKGLIASLSAKSDDRAYDTEARMGFFDESMNDSVAGTQIPLSARDLKQVERSKSMPTSLAFKIDAAKVDAVMNMVGELVVIKSQLIETLPASQLSDVRTRAVIGLLDKSVRELHEKTLAMRMLSLKTCFLKIQRMARDLSQKLGKPIDFTMIGEDTELDRALIEQISDPLMHLCRNAIDHGIESAADRRRVGKAAEGKVSLRAYRRGEGVSIEILDDGGGIKKERVVKKALERGLVTPNFRLETATDAQVFELLFLPGFSTATEVTDVSGRGVGLDVVKSNIVGIKGRVEVESKEGASTCFRLMIPLTTAITDGIIVALRGQKYVVPVECMKSFVEAKHANLLPLQDGKSMIGVAGQHYALLNAPGISPEKCSSEVLYLLLDVMDRTVALAVDGVHGKAQVVLKGLRGSVDKSGYFSGAAVMGDGKVALVLDIIGLSAAAGIAAKGGRAA